MIRLFKVSIPSSAVALVISEAVLLFLCYLLAAWLVLDVPLVVFYSSRADIGTLPS